ncbi:hypothetical protein [Streptomyces benahoarensis]|uniref:Uncharacterized protein n=1 Tax=Streptomyces benahoarensis TaxID=2595054 RepID=A0A553ZAI4_9ACTN|nr:hypothetical protein [Streptomyces benahoarensis]TSB21162.1 hypothetical protein FNJ62_19765 [Streptomyces benahoarensis]TSB38442.1 hypothetical protein FNZ23_17155 [Streptomyces benahoarensis]
MRVDVRGNKRSRIIIAGGNVTEKDPLPVTEIPHSELDVVRQAWVTTGADGGTVSTAADAFGLLASDGPALAVIAGPSGYGKRAAGIRALWDVSQAEQIGDGTGLALAEIQPDWDKPKAPDTSLMPDEPGTCYLLDVAAEIRSWERPGTVATALVERAEKLRQIGSYLVVIVDEHGWPEEESTSLATPVVRVKSRPSPHQVATAHLEFVHRKPERLGWLDTTASTTGTGMVGKAANLLHKETSTPADAARLATLLAQTDYSVQGLDNAIAAFRQWRKAVVDFFEKTEAMPADRALLIAALFLSGDKALSIEHAAQRLLGKSAEENVEVILSGPDLTARLEAVHAKVTERHATLDHRPGYAQAVLNHLWRQRPDIHMPLLKWLDDITAPGNPGATRLAAISDLLVELAITENDIKVIEKIRTWITNGNTSNEHLQLIAGVFAKAAEADGLGAKVRARLLDWAKDDEEAVAEVIALVCQSDFANHFPRQTLVRLRHILDRAEPDAAVQTAEEALRALAADPRHLPRVWGMVIKWVTEHGHLAGHRAFLSLLNPQHDPYVLQVLLESAEQNSEVKQELLRGWRAALTDARVSTQCRDLMIAWAHARADDLVPYELTTDILRQVVAEHMYDSPVTAFVFGEAGVSYDEPVIALRKDLQLPIRPPAPRPSTNPQPWKS